MQMRCGMMCLTKSLAVQIIVERVNIFERHLAYSLAQLVLTGAGREVEVSNRRPNMKMIKKIFTNKKGATAIEYGLIAALIAVAAISAMQGLGSNLTSTFNTVSNKLK